MHPGTREGIEPLRVSVAGKGQGTREDEVSRPVAPPVSSVAFSRNRRLSRSLNILICKVGTLVSPSRSLVKKT